MCKLTRWNNRETPLQAPDGTLYEGRVLREVGDSRHFDGRIYKNLSYYYLTNDGRRIDISNTGVKATYLEGRRILKLNSEPRFL